MPFIQFPNIPNVLGTPGVQRPFQYLHTAVTYFLGGIESDLLRMYLTKSPQWGIWDNDVNITEDYSFLTLSTLSFSYQKETRISEYPIENGSFVSYNKVEMPASSNVTLCLSASESEKSYFLDWLESKCISATLLTVVTPDKNYIDHTLEKYSYQRNSKSGASLLIVDLSLRQIRQITPLYFNITGNSDTDVSLPISSTDTKLPEHRTPCTLGKVFPSPPTERLFKRIMPLTRNLGEERDIYNIY